MSLKTTDTLKDSSLTLSSIESYPAVPSQNPKSHSETRARLIAFYLPQFQPTLENDEWWGKGFTEWTNVAKAKPLFKNHYQPRIPADLGFYDLRVPETRAAQAELARSHNIEGFCYWHYWFEGRRLLDLVEKEVLRLGEPNFPFCLAWANHNWSRSWLGDTKQILVEQTYSDDDVLRHARYLADFFADPRYIRVNGRPLFLVYAPFELPEPKRMMDMYRAEIVRLGLPDPFLLSISTRKPSDDARPLGFDGNIDMWPKFTLFDYRDVDWRFKRLLKNGLKYGIWNGGLRIYDYEELMERMLKYQYTYPHYKCVCVGWDNTARRGKTGWILTEEKPEVFERILSQTIEQSTSLPAQERLVFLNAWNEWGEGMHLEPDLRHGTAFLEAVRRANTLTESSTRSLNTNHLEKRV